MSVSPEILAKQEAYAARPFAAYVNSSHYSCAMRFHTEAEAIDYLFQMLKVTKEYANDPSWAGSWVGFDCGRSYLERSDGERIPAKFVFMEGNFSRPVR